MWCLLDAFFINIGVKPSAQISAPTMCVVWIELAFQGLNHRTTTDRFSYISLKSRFFQNGPVYIFDLSEGQR